MGPVKTGTLWKLLISVGPGKKGILRPDNLWKLLISVSPATKSSLRPANLLKLLISVGPVKIGTLRPGNLWKLLNSVSPAKISTLKPENLWKLLISVGLVKNGTLRPGKLWKLVTLDSVILPSLLNTLILKNLLQKEIWENSFFLKSLGSVRPLDHEKLRPVRENWGSTEVGMNNSCLLTIVTSASSGPLKTVIW